MVLRYDPQPRESDSGFPGMVDDVVATAMLLYEETKILISNKNMIDCKNVVCDKKSCHKHFFVVYINMTNCMSIVLSVRDA